MLKKVTFLIWTLTVSFCFVLMQNAFAQNTSPTQTNQTTKTPETVQTPSSDCDDIKKELGIKSGYLGVGGTGYAILTEKRDKVLADIVLLEQKVADLKVQIEDALTEEEIKNRNDQIKELKKKNQNDADFEMKFNYRRDLKSKESLEDELKTTEPKLERARLKRSCIQVAISEIRTPEQDFKMTMSSIFALLIGLVIFGFFGLAFKDDIIRRAIFSGETGIQFLTLFSIVIAIILFGITSILEGKELAALLGGLSGYILGRYSSSTSNQSPS